MPDPKEISELPDAGALGWSDYIIIQQGETGTPLTKITIGAAFSGLIDEIGTGTIVADDVLITGGIATLDILTAEIANIGTVSIKGGTGTLSKGTITTLTSTTINAGTVTVSGTATVGHVIGTTGAIGTITGTLGTFETLAGTIVNADTLIASAGTAILQQATVTTLVTGSETIVSDARYLFPSADINGDGDAFAATDINGGVHVPAVTTDAVTASAGTVTSVSAVTLVATGVSTLATVVASSGTIAGDTYAPDTRYLFPSVLLDADGAALAADDINGGHHAGAITAPEATIPILNGTVTAGGLVVPSATIASGAITDDARYLFPDASIDEDGGALLAADIAGNYHVNRLTGTTLRMTDAPSSSTDVVNKAYFDANAGGGGGGGGGSTYLEPATYADAPTDGVTDASGEVETTIAAVLALEGRESRKMAVDYVYQVPGLATDNIGDIIPVGDGDLADNNQYKTVIPADAPFPPPPRRSLVVRRDLPTYAAAVRANAGPITVVITGDSTSGRNVAGMNFMSSPHSSITRYLQAAAPGVTFDFRFRGIGGTTMAELDTVPDWAGATIPVWYDPDDTTPWLDVIAADSPVLVIVHGGRNQNDDFAVATPKSIAEKIIAMGADCLFVNSYGEVPITDDTARNDRLAAGLFLHAFATTYGPGVGGIDTLSYENIARFGFDPSNLAPMRSGGWFADGVMPTAITDLPLPYTCPTKAHGWSFSCRIPAGKWATMGDAMWFQIGNEHNAENLGQRLELRRTGANMIEWRIMITSTAAGAAGDYDFTAWTETGITVTDSDLVKFDVGQMGNRIVLMWRDGGSPTTLADLSYSPVDIRVPRAGGAYQMTIGCAAGSVTGCVYMSTGTDGKSSGALAIPIKQQLYMPVLTGKEFAPPANTDFALWGGNGPHPSALVWQYVTDPVMNAQDWSAW